jgi:TupA-like ATPgrasp
MLSMKRKLRRLVPALVLEHHDYRKAHGSLPNIWKPTRFTEKVVRRKFFDRNPLYSELSDKYKVRDHIARMVGQDVLVPLVLATKTPTDLLRMTCWAKKVIKPNHGAMMIEIVGEEEPDDTEKRRIVSQCESWLGIDFSRRANEYHYSRIDPHILVEDHIGDNGQPPIECKVHCFPQSGGAVEVMLQIIAGRFEAPSMAFYLGRLTPDARVRTTGDDPPTIESIDRDLLERAIAHSKTLCQGLDYVRIDWLVTERKLYFSEMTFTPGAGLSTSFGPDLDRYLAGLWTSRDRL